MQDIPSASRGSKHGLTLLGTRVEFPWGLGSAGAGVGRWGPRSGSFSPVVSASWRAGSWRSPSPALRGVSWRTAQIRCFLLHSPLGLEAADPTPWPGEVEAQPDGQAAGRDLSISSVKCRLPTGQLVDWPLSAGRWALGAGCCGAAGSCSLRTVGGLTE